MPAARAAKLVAEDLMLAGALSIHGAVASARRFPFTTSSTARPAAWEVATLAAIGVATGLASSYIKLNLGIPGHAIVLSVLPIALGVSLVPRRFAGSMMSASCALVMALAARTGLGAIASALATGIFLDLALRRARPGVGLHVAFLLAGMGGNAVAWIVRAAGKLGGMEAGLVRFSSWWMPSLAWYALCGAIAGVASAALWFRARRGSARPGA